MNLAALEAEERRLVAELARLRDEVAETRDELLEVRVLAFLQRRPGASSNDVANGATGERRRIFDALRTLQAAGRIAAAAGPGREQCWRVVREEVPPDEVVRDGEPPAPLATLGA